MKKRRFKRYCRRYAREKEYFSFGWSGVTQKALKFYAMQLHRKRIKLGIKRKIIVSESLKGCKELKQPLTELKFLPEKVFYQYQ